MDTCNVSWSRGRQFIATDNWNHGIVLDLPEAYGGDGAGTRPLELFLEALAGCTAMDVVSILEKKRQDVRGLDIRIEGDQREEQPRIYTAIRLHYLVTGYDVKPEAVARAIELSEEKYCSVKGMLGPQVTVTTSFEIFDARAAGTAALEVEERS